MTTHPSPALPPERIDELTRRLACYSDSDYGGLQTGDMRVGELRALLAAAKRLVEADLLVEQFGAWLIRAGSARLRKALLVRVRAFLSPAPAIEETTR